jgi:hypothetical protein
VTAFAASASRSGREHFRSYFGNTTNASTNGYAMPGERSGREYTIVKPLNVEFTGYSGNVYDVAPYSNTTRITFFAENEVLIVVAGAFIALSSILGLGLVERAERERWGKLTTQQRR